MGEKLHRDKMAAKHRKMSGNVFGKVIPVSAKEKARKQKQWEVLKKNWDDFWLGCGYLGSEVQGSINNIQSAFINNGKSLDAYFKGELPTEVQEEEQHEQEFK